MKQQIERMRALAKEARKQYDEEMAAGGEPPYPQWTDDAIAVCDLAERRMGIDHEPERA